MLKTRVPLFFRKSQIVLVDDNKDFLNAMELALSVLPHITVISFTDPTNADRYLMKHVKENDALFQSALESTQEIEGDSDRVYSYLNYKKLFPFKQGENIISAIISDFSMPKMTGIDLLKKYINYFPSRILLTGEADTNLAVEAFNNQVINYFYMKNKTSNQKIVENILNYINEFFVRVSDSLDNFYYRLRGNPFFINIINSWIDEFNITTYSFYYDSGSVLGLDNNGNERWLFLLNEQQYIDYIDILKTQGLSEDKLEKVQSKQLMFVTPTEYSKNQIIDSNSIYFFPIRGKFEDQFCENTYYAYTTKDMHPIY